MLTWTDLIFHRPREDTCVCQLSFSIKCPFKPIWVVVYLGKSIHRTTEIKWTLYMLSLLFSWKLFSSNALQHDTNWKEECWEFQVPHEIQRGTCEFQVPSLYMRHSFGPIWRTLHFKHTCTVWTIKAEMIKIVIKLMVTSAIRAQM